MTGPDDTPLLHPGAAAARLGVASRTLADWADAGIIAAIVTAGGHRRDRASDIDVITTARAERTAAEARPGTDLNPARNPAAVSIHRSPRTSADRDRGRDAAAAPTVQAWVAPAAGYQTDGSAIRQIIACTGTLPATVAVRITRPTRRASG